MAGTDKRHALRIYLNDHLAGAAGGVELARRAARAHRGSADGEQLSRLAADIAADQATLLSIRRSLRIRVQWYKSAAGWAAEKAARLKFNGRLLARSPLSDLVELEGLLLAVHGKAAGWRTLLAISGREPGLDAGQLRDLLARADRQLALLEQLRVAAAGRLLGQASRAASGAEAAR